MNASRCKRTGLVLAGTLLVVMAACSSGNKANNNGSAAPASSTVAAAGSAGTAVVVRGTAVNTGSGVSVTGTAGNTSTAVSVTGTASSAATATGVRSTAVAAATTAATSIAGALKIGTGTAAAAGAASSGGALTDCEYAAKFQAALLGFLGSFLDLAGNALGAALSGSPTPGAAAANAQATQAYDKLNAAVGQVITNLQGLKLPPDLKQVNDRVIAAFQSLATPLAEATTAARAGDLVKAQSIMDTLNTSFPAIFDQLDKDFPEVTARLSKCA